MEVKEKIINILKKETNLEDINLEVPPNPEFGDYAFPCFQLAKIQKKKPVEIANELAQKIKNISEIKKIEVKGPYLNFFIDKSAFAEKIIDGILKKKEKYGCSGEGKGKKALIEHTSINPNASPHVGRARNALIGDCLAKLLKFQEYKTETHYLVNDIGKQIAMCVIGSKGKKVSFSNLLKVYVDVNKRMSDKIEKQAFELLNKLEKKDKKVVKQFRDIVEVCVEGQKKIFAELGIVYNYFDYESDYLWNKKTEEVLKKLEKTKKLFKDKEGRMVLNQEEFKLAMKAPYLVLTRADRTSLYSLRDLAYTIDKVIKRHDKNIVVLGEDQKLYFQQIKAALSTIGYGAPEAVHYSFVLLKEGKMSTRKGNVVLLEEFMEEAIRKAKQEILKRNKKINKKELENLSKAIAFGAIKYSILKVSPDKNVFFDWEQALSFEGDSGPYIQYSYARICSILKKYGKKIGTKIDYAYLDENIEKNIITQLGSFPEVVNQSLIHLKPHLIANYLYELAKSFNEFYHQCNILKEIENIRDARLVLILCIKQVLENGLDLLGIDAPERM